MRVFQGIRFRPNHTWTDKMTKRWGTLEEAIAVAGVAIGTAVAIRGWPTWPWPDANGQTWAAWIQAIGSIAAIAGAFVLGNWQARIARETALELERTRESNRIKGLAGVYSHLLKLSYNTLRQLQEANPQSFPEVWNGPVSGWLKSAIEAASQLPRHDLGTPERMFCAVRIQDMAASVYELAAASAAKGRDFKFPRFTDDAALDNVIDLYLAVVADLREEHLRLYR